MRLICNLIVVIAAVMLTLTGQAANAQTWVGTSGTALWNLTSNWSGVAPVSGGTSALVFSGTTLLTSTNNIANLTVSSISFANNATGSPGFLLSGSAVTLRGGITVGSLASNGGTVTEEIALGLILAASPTINLATGANSSHSVIISGSIGQDATSRSITRSGNNGFLYLTNTANTFSGGVSTVGNGSLVVSQLGMAGQPSQIGTGSVISIGNNSQFFYTGVGETSDKRVTVGAGANGSLFFANGTGALVLTGGGQPFNTVDPSATNATRILQVGGTSTAANTIRAALVDVNSGTAPLTVTKAGSGLWILSGTNTYTGTTTVSAGTLQIGEGGTAGTLGTGAVSNAATLVFNRSDSYGGDVSNAISGAGALRVSGGSLTLTGSNSYTGATTINAGTLKIGGAGQLVGTTGTYAGNVSVASGATFEYGSSVNASLSGTISGAGGVTKSGASTLTLRGVNTYGGTTRVTAGTLALAASNVLSGSTAVAVGGGALDISSFAPSVAGFTLTSGSLIGTGTLTSTTAYDMQSGSVLANLRGSVGLVKTTAGTVTLSGNNSYSGDTQIAAGTLQLGSNTALPTSSALTLGTGSTSALLAFNGNTATLGSITFNGSGSLVGSGTGGKLNLLASGTNNATITVATGSHALHPDTTLQSNTVIDVSSGALFSLHGTIDGTKSLTKLGSGTLTIYGANSYSGGNYLNGGFVNVMNTGALGSGTATVTIDGNTILNLNNTILNNPIVFGSGSGAIINSGTLVNVTGTYSITSGTGSSITTNYNVQSGGDISFVNDLAATVEVQAGARGSFTSDVLANGTVEVNGGGRGVFSGNVAGIVFTSGSSAFSGSVLGSVTVQGGTANFSSTTGAASAVNVDNGLAVFTGTVGGIAHATATGATLEIRNRVLSTADVNAEAGGVVKLMGSQDFDGTTIDNDGSVIVDRSANFALAAVISGSGSLTKSDNLTLTLTGNNTFTGLTTISGGTLSVGNGGTNGALAGNVVNNAALIFNRSDDSTYAGGIAGSGGLTKLGAGKLTLTGSSSYAGTTTVTSGTLAVNGQIASAVAVASGATLGGSGVIAGVLSGAGIVSPGNSPGILTATQFNPIGGLDTAFELTSLSPVYNAPSASVNDILRLTSGTPFTGSLGSGNVIDVYFNMDSVGSGPYEGGFFTSLSAAELLTALQSATVNYWIKDSGGSQFFNGVNYSSYSGVTLSTATVTRDFGSGGVTGSVTQFIIVPEPESIVLAFGGIAVAAWAARRRLS